MTGFKKKGWDRDGRMRALVEAALQVFAERGYEAATTKEISAKAHCAEGLISHYFGSKEGLLKAVIARDFAKTHEGVRQTLPLANDLGADLKGLAHAVLEGIWQRRSLLRVVVSRAIIDATAAQHLRLMFSAGSKAELVDRLRRHQLAGRIPADANVGAAADVFMAALFQIGFMRQIVFEESRDELAHGVDSVTFVVMKALASKEN